MKTFESSADIIVISPEREYLMVVEVKVQHRGDRYKDHAIQQLKQHMVSVGCMIGLLIISERLILLHDSLEKFNGESIEIIGEAHFPYTLLPTVDEEWNINPGLALAIRVQKWLEKLQITGNLEDLPYDLKNLLGESIIHLLRLGEVRAGHPRWKQVLHNKAK